MVIVYESDKYNYLDKQRHFDLIKYSNGVKKIHKNMEFYLLRRHYDGKGILRDIIKYLFDEKFIIKYFKCCSYNFTRFWEEWY